MAIYNNKTGEKKFVGCIIFERGTFRMDTSMDEVTYWCMEEHCVKVEYLCQGDWYVERGSDLCGQALIEYEAYQVQKQINFKAFVEEQNKKTLVVGSKIKIVRGRLVPKGTEGTVTAIFLNDAYCTVYFSDKDGKQLKTYSKNVELLVEDKFTEDFRLQDDTKKLISRVLEHSRF